MWFKTPLELLYIIFWLLYITISNWIQRSPELRNETERELCYYTVFIVFNNYTILNWIQQCCKPTNVYLLKLRWLLVPPDVCIRANTTPSDQLYTEKMLTKSSSKPWSFVWSTPIIPCTSPEEKRHPEKNGKEYLYSVL